VQKGKAQKDIGLMGRTAFEKVGSESFTRHVISEFSKESIGVFDDL
jgi:hypothetical protein